MTSKENFVHLLSETHEDVTFSDRAKQLNSGIFVQCKRVMSDERDCQELAKGCSY